MKDNPRIVISLVNWYRYEDTIQCIREIQQNIENIEYTISVVDNASPNDSYEKIKCECSNIRIVKSNENLGYAGGHLVNVEYAINNNYDAVWILNSDIILSRNSLAPLISAWQENGNHIYGSITVTEEEPNVVDFGGGLSWTDSPNEFVYNLYSGKKLEDLPTVKIREVQSVEGCSMLIPIEVIRQYGFMKTDFFLYGEENDYCFRLYKYGIKSYVITDSVVIHSSSASFKLSTDISWIMAYYRRRNYLRLMSLYFGWSRMRIFKENNSIVSQIKFILKYLLYPSFRKSKKIDYYRLKGTFHSVMKVKGKTIEPNNYI